LAVRPPLKPDVAETTPGICSKADSVDQKQPPAKTALAVGPVGRAGTGSGARAECWATTPASATPAAINRTRARSLRTAAISGLGRRRT
jgi:hypothetical protein